MNIGKAQLAKLMRLDNPKADQYLSGAAVELQREIEGLTVNEDIFGRLDLLEAFIYKVPKTAIEIIDFVVRHPQPATLRTSVFGDFEGKAHRDLLIRCAELLGSIRYLEPDAVLERLAPLVCSEDGKVRDSAKNALTKLAKYDIGVLTKTQIGYGFQATALAFIKRWSPAEQLVNIDFVDIVVTELLTSSLEGAYNDTPESLAIRQGPIHPTESLKRMRRETFDVVSHLYEKALDEPTKLRLVKLLRTSTRLPVMGYGDDVLGMISDDAQYLVGVLRRMLIDEDKTLAGSLSVAEEVEEMMGWFHDSLHTAGASDLRSDILANPVYIIFRILAGNAFTFLREEGFGAESKRSSFVDALVEEVEYANLDRWLRVLNLVAGQLGVLPESRFGWLDTFLWRLATRKPDQAQAMLLDSLRKGGALRRFAESMLRGFRDAGRVDLWDLGVQEIVASRDICLVRAIPYSLVVNRDLDLAGELRDKDLGVLDAIARERDDFTFLGGLTESDVLLRHSVLMALMRTFRRDPTRAEGLMIEELHSHPKQQTMQLGVLNTALLRGWIDFGQLSPDGICFLKSWLVDLRDLDWEAQRILRNIGQQDLGVILEVIWRRIERAVETEEAVGKMQLLLGDARYEAVPHNLDHELIARVSDDPHIFERIEPWLEKVTYEHSLYNSYVGQMLSDFGILGDVLSGLMDRGDDAELGRVVQLASWGEHQSIALLMAVVGRTDDDGILGRIDGLLRSTGVVFGEYGIPCELSGRAEAIEAYLSDPNERVRRYAERTIKALKEAAGTARQRVEEQRVLRRIEFDG